MELSALFSSSTKICPGRAVQMQRPLSATPLLVLNLQKCLPVCGIFENLDLAWIVRLGSLTGSRDGLIPNL